MHFLTSPILSKNSVKSTCIIGICNLDTTLMKGGGSATSKRDKLSRIPSLNLTPEGESALRSLANDLVEDVVNSFECVMYDQNGTLDKENYKVLKRDFSVVVYRERYKYHAFQKANLRDQIRKSMSTLTSETELKYEGIGTLPSKGLGGMNGPMAHFLAESEVPTLIAVGSVPGTLEEAMLGVSLRDTVAFSSLMSSSVKKVLNAQVLATVSDTLQKDTFDYLGVHWTLCAGFGGLCRQMSPRLDQLQLVHSRITATSHGDRIGVCILHAIKHPDVPEMKQSPTRIYTTLALSFREKLDGSVDFMAISSAQSAPPLLYSVMLRRVVGMLCSIPHCIEFANSRKLLAMMLSNSVTVGLQSLKEATLVSSARQRLARRLLPGQCSGCYKISCVMYRSFNSSCKICKARVCARCCVSKKITLSGEKLSNIASDLATIKVMRFCLPCIHAARQLACSQTKLHHDLK
uniref:Uncharacterized protein AlNc14C242G9495 n=1 Tax=Albugo laibachii Nc14 TaxID=890382 RepID=F0WT05_9STRA|nr:conserved hypothetical protein [Albugo laibachii Nc14]|eukprot:CCA24490.1 conserved hypothetical protein [Albugo laibachii Nc14]